MSTNVTANEENGADRDLAADELTEVAGGKTDPMYEIYKQKWMAAYGSSKGDANYNASVDFDGDGVITDKDMQLIQQKYGG